MSMSLAILPPLIGGLGIFLLGMKHLSEASGSIIPNL